RKGSLRQLSFQSPPGIVIFRGSRPISPSQVSVNAVLRLEMVMMNAGFLLAANALATVCIHPGIPVLMLIGHSGGVGEENAGHATVGALTEPVLQAMHIVYEKVGRFE